MSDNDMSAPVVAFRKVGTKKKQQAIRKRDAPKSEDSGSSSGVDSDTITGASSAAKRLAKKRSKMTQSTRKRETINEDSSSGSDSEQEVESQKNNKLEIDVKYSSAGLNKSGPNDMGATARTEHDTDYNADSQAQFERIQKILTQRAKEEQEGGTALKGERLYQGQAMYGATLQKDTAKGNAKSGLNRLGPIRATQYMRASVRWDYAPDICKDYKETGFCTFGDSCKFMHDRGDYKHGWELERDWEEGKLKESKDDEYLVTSEEDNDDDDDLPFACFVCRQEFKFPVSTKCNHYFCESCAVAKCKIRCAVCNEKTDGQFNVAKTLLKKLKERKERQEKKPHEDSDLEEDETDDLPPETVMENAEEPNDDEEELQEMASDNEQKKDDDE
jgi:RING finger protein 113A